MNIQITKHIIGDENLQAVDARQLHGNLEVKTEFKDWIKRKIKKYDFVDGSDFSSFLSESIGGRPSTEYVVTIHMAKELAMLENNDQGKKIRKYFIEVEKKARNQIQALPQNYEEALEQLLSATKHNNSIKVIVKKQEELLALQSPLAEIGEDFIKSKDKSMRFDDFCHTLGDGLGRTTVFRILRAAKYFYKGNDNHNRPFQTYINKGYFNVIWNTRLAKHNPYGVDYPRVEIMPKGIKFFTKSKLLELKKKHNI
jgi:phage anti-repressor protein